MSTIPWLLHSTRHPLAAAARHPRRNRTGDRTQGRGFVPGIGHWSLNRGGRRSAGDPAILGTTLRPEALRPHLSMSLPLTGAQYCPRVTKLERCRPSATRIVSVCRCGPFNLAIIRCPWGPPGCRLRFLGALSLVPTVHTEERLNSMV